MSCLQGQDSRQKKTNLRKAIFVWRSHRPFVSLLQIRQKVISPLRAADLHCFVSTSWRPKGAQQTPFLCRIAIQIEFCHIFIPTMVTLCLTCLTDIKFRRC